MTDRDIGPMISPADVPAAIGLLTRLPVPVDGDRATKRGAAAVWAYPVAGFLVAVVCACFGTALIWLGLPAALTAALVLGCGAAITGAMHEDGLADVADGFWGGWDADHRLKIMKDSNIGTYGVLALAVTLILRWQALALVIDAGLLWPALIAVAVMSRASMVLVMWRLPHARDHGLSRAVGQAQMRPALLACLIAAFGGGLLGAWVLWLVPLAGLATLAVALVARAKIGGQTGDVLGATQQISELSLWLGLSVLVN